MPYLHPILQMAAIALALAALALALPRILSLHFNRRMVFKRAGHMLWGKLGLWLMLAGLGGGLVMTRLLWGEWLKTGQHGFVGLVMLPLLGLGLLSGQVLAESKRPRRPLALLHGLNNLVLLGLAFWQADSGAAILSTLSQAH